MNGRIPRSELRRIAHPTYVVYLAKEAAASWNTMNLAARIPLYPNGQYSAYRDLAGQVLMKKLYGDNAAAVGFSNHGWGLAVDLASMAMRAVVDAIGRQFGWAKEWSDASWEWWHLKYREGVWKPRPNPGISRTYPVLRLGSGGPGQDRHVKKCKKHLRQAGIEIGKSGEFGETTRAKVREFQRAAGMKPDGVVGPKTWIKLRSRRIRRSVKSRRTG